MDMQVVIQERVTTLQSERQQLAERLAHLDAERQRTVHLISAYDGALGELQRLLEGSEENVREAQG